MASMLRVNPDLLKERQAATFNVERLTNLLDRGEDSTKRRREIQARALQEKVFTEGPDTDFLSREELYDVSVKKTVRMRKLMKELDLTDFLEKMYVQSVAFPMSTPPDGLHHSMFINTLENQCTPEQKEWWLQKAYNCEFIGTYSQTELGHGTHLRGLETISTYDPQTEEFVLHMPTLTAMKWWPGGQGKTSNCAVIIAKLLTQGKDHGTYPFFVIFRDPNTHQPLPGVSVGDIGPKMGFNTIDNGFLKLDHFRIPRENMLMKHAEVLKDGTFVQKTKMKKPTYSSMTIIRTNIVQNSGRALSAALTIAVRYSAVRRQSELKPGAPEPQILDYQTQQYKLFPYLSMAYGFMLSAQNLFQLFIEGMGRMQNGDDSMMPELHALSSGLKAYCSGNSLSGIEMARLACGGHGYSQASGLPNIYTIFAPSCTVEGENSVLFLQAARYLIKCYDSAKAGQPLPESVAYLKKMQGSRSSLDGSIDVNQLQDLFEHKAYRLITEAASAIAEQQNNGIPEYEAKNACGVQLTRAAIAHCEMFVIKSFVSMLHTLEDPAIKKVLTDLCRLLGAYHIVNKAGDFLEDGYLTAVQLKQIQEKEVQLLAELRPNAVGLVDAFDYPDEALHSILGRYDGNVYENLYKWALSSPLNKTQVHESYYKYLQPMMKAKI